MEDIIEERKQKLINKFNLKKNWYWGIFVVIIWFGYWIRTRNLGFLIDSTTGKYIPLALDPYAFLRYAKNILETGSLVSIDYMRYYPWGYANMIEFKLLSYFIVYLYKFLSFFNSSMTIEKAHVLYPPIAFVIGLVFFFLLVKKLLNYKVALLSSLLLSIIPMYLYRTMAGFSDKESFAMIFFFIILYFFIIGWDSKNWKKTIGFGALSGILTGAMGLVWGGVYFIVMIIALFAFISLFFIRFRTYHFLAYANWLILFSLFLIIFRSAGIMGLIGGLYNGFAFFVLLSGCCYYFLFVKNLFKIKNKIKNKFPLGLSAILFGGIVGLIFFIFYDFSFVIGNVKSVYVTLTSPFGQSRWALTVAEAHQPFFLDWIGQMSWKYVLVFLISSSWLFYDMGRKFFDKKNRIISTCLYSLVIIGFVFNRYSQGSVFNGESNISRILYFGSIMLFGLYFVYYYITTFKKSKKSFNRKKNINEFYLMIIIWFFITLVGARSASRLLFVLAPITTVLFSFIIFRLFDLSLRKKDVYKIGVWILIFLILINPFSLSTGFVYGLFDKGVVNDFYIRSSAQARGTGPSYNMQWQQAGGWVRDNIAEDAVFSHWWDYGYWVQTGFERASVTDGGNAKGSLNHMMGRYFLTGQNEIEALEFLKAHNVTHSLMISDEIGKYPAFSSIGADRDWDRYSWINVFARDDSKIQETRDNTVYVYTGGTPVDWDFEYKGKLYPKGSSGIIAIFLPTLKSEGNAPSFLQPRAVVAYNGQQEQIPLECLFINGEEVKFAEEGLKGCFVMIPKIDGNQADVLGNGFYISEKVRNTLFYKMYLTGQEMEYFKLVYSDEVGMPLSVYNGRIIGPLKIWEVSYPEDLVVPEIYYEDRLPDPSVGNVEGRY